MKSQRRHELHENALAAEFAKVSEFFRRHGTKMTWGVLIVVLILFVVVYARSKSRQTAGRLQGQFDKAMTDPKLSGDERVSLLESLAAQRDDQTKAALAMVELGDEYARRMTAAGPTNDPADWKRLADRAAAYYRRVVNEYGDERLAAGRAHLGLAKLAESQRDIDVARNEYQAVLRYTELAGHPVVLLAEKGLQDLTLLAAPVEMASTAPAETQPASQPVGETGSTQPAL